MPKAYKIYESPNPTGLTMHERRLALDVLRSFEDSVNRERKRVQRFHWRRDWYVRRSLGVES